MRNVKNTFNVGETVNLLVPVQDIKTVKCKIVKHFENEYVLETEGKVPFYYMVNNEYLSYCNSPDEPYTSEYVDITDYIPELKRKVIIARGKEYDYDIKSVEIVKGMAKNIDIGTPTRAERAEGSSVAGSRQIIPVVTTLKFALVPGNLPLNNVKKWCHIPVVAKTPTNESDSSSDMSTMSRKELLGKAKELGIDGKIATMKGEELMKRINEALEVK